MNNNLITNNSFSLCKAVDLQGIFSNTSLEQWFNNNFSDINNPINALLYELLKWLNNTKDECDNWMQKIYEVVTQNPLVITIIGALVISTAFSLSQSTEKLDEQQSFDKDPFKSDTFSKIASFEYKDIYPDTTTEDMLYYS